MSRATQTFANTWGKTRSGSTYWPEIGHQTSPGRSSRRCSPQCLSRLRRTHTVIVIDTSPDLEHDVMKAVLQSTDTLVFVSGITADRSRPVLRAVDYLRAQGYHELVSMQVLAICVLVGLLVLIRMTPTVALWVARVRPPHFGSITGRDLFARRAGMPVDTVAPVSEADADDEDNELTDITARGTAIAASARLVNAVQVGMCVGVSLVLPAAVWGVLTPRQPWAWLALLVAGLTVGLFITQGRGFAAKYQAVALVCGASAAVCAGVLKYALDTPKGVQTGLLWPAIFVAAFAALGLAVALVVPATRFRPIIRLTVEWLEVLAMIALLPAAAALGGLFAWLRH